jgi:hypothetical protein
MAAGSAVIHVSAMSVMFGKVSEKMAEVGDGSAHTCVARYGGLPGMDRWKSRGRRPRADSGDA